MIDTSASKRDIIKKGKISRKLCPGKPYPLGATWDGMGVNFALYSEHAAEVKLCLFDSAADEHPLEITLEERTGPIHHGYLPGVRPGQLYGFKVWGESSLHDPDGSRGYRPHEGHRFNPNKILLDPYAKAIGRPLQWDDSLFGYEIGKDDLSFSTSSNARFAPLGAVIESAFEWGNESPIRVPWEDTVIYETHVKGISKLHPDVPEYLRGTYLGLATEPILEHLKELGVTTVQLLPVHAKVHDRHLIEKNLSNYWGYNTLSFFSPETDYATAPGMNSVREFKMMVRTLHAHGFEVIIDVVYNHTAEGNHMGPTLSFRGIDNKSYYKEVPDDPRYLMDFTGTGNTFDAGNEYVLQLITDSLRYWVTEMHVDGFRFDLASTLARELFEVNMLSSFFKIIQQDPVLSQVKLIAEPWDVGPGSYQVGSFPWLWAEWNGRYRDTVRGFWAGDGSIGNDFATRLTGSADLYTRSGRRPFASVNFITAHDGFTLNDLVSYNDKHNEANGEGGQDGDNNNHSTNAGVEGPTEEEEVNAIRDARKRSLVSTLFLAQGVPMILGGDELSRTQQGNNNTYCQDNELNWYDWSMDERKEDFLQFVQDVIAYRREHQNFRRRYFLTGERVSEDFQPDEENGIRDASWWHPDGHEMGPDEWHNDAHAIALLLRGDRIRGKSAYGDRLVDVSHLLLFNGSDTTVTFNVPEPANLGKGFWRVAPPFERGIVSDPEGSEINIGRHEFVLLEWIPETEG